VTLAACLFLLVAATPFNPPHRRGDVPHETVVGPCMHPDKTITNIEKVSFDTHPYWPVYEYVAFYLYSQDIPFIVVRFDEQGEMIDARLHGIPISPQELLYKYEDPCNALMGTET